MAHSQYWLMIIKTTVSVNKQLQHICYHYQSFPVIIQHLHSLHIYHIYHIPILCHDMLLYQFIITNTFNFMFINFNNDWFNLCTFIILNIYSNCFISSLSSVSAPSLFRYLFRKKNIHFCIEFWRWMNENTYLQYFGLANLLMLIQLTKHQDSLAKFDIYISSVSCSIGRKYACHDMITWQS